MESAAKENVIASANAHRAQLHKPWAPHMSVNLPVLSLETSRETLLTWCSKVDRNGSFSDEQCAAEGLDPLSLDDAWDLVAQLLASA